MKIITVEHLSKYYTIGHDRDSGVIRYKTFRESMMSAGRGLYQRLRHPLSPNREQVELEEFKALDDVSFEVEQGDRIGIIGRNGAGKSTLLKLLCRITEPTKGRITMRGRVASLLEVGTGFHPELSGRENIYLNGAILGMKRAEIKRKFDEIVDFSGVEKFLDTPVKRYSSGMYVRLAFAVAAHLESEILLIDEVLAVGDAEFQKKCLGKMDDISKNEGRTILFVSHNMGAIKNLCNKGILLSIGKILYSGDCHLAIRNYMSFMQKHHVHSLAARSDRKGNGTLRFQSIQIRNHLGENSNILQTGASAEFVIQIESSQERKNEDIEIAIRIDNDAFIHLTTLNIRNLATHLQLKKGINTIIFKIPQVPFFKGNYHIILYADVDKILADRIEYVTNFAVLPGSYYGGAITQANSSLFAIDYSVACEVKL